MNGATTALLTLLLAAPAAAPNAWELAADTDGVKVFTRPVAGSGYKAFKAVALVEATPQEVLAVLDDVEGYPAWFAYTEEAKRLEGPAEEKLFYLQTAFPWPFANEDMVYRLTRTQPGPNTVRVQLEGLPDRRPPVAGVHRMKRARGHIDVERVGRHTKVTYVMHSELGGRIPLWMANQNIHELPLRTLQGLKRQLRK